MTALLPDWLLTVSTMLALAVFVTGRARLAALLAAPALLRFVLWPTVFSVLGGIPVYVLIIVGVLMLPVVAMRAVRSFLILFVGAEATDHALGRALGQGIIHVFYRHRRRR
jgi:hypothetical protein